METKESISALLVPVHPHTSKEIQQNTTSDIFISYIIQSTMLFGNQAINFNNKILQNISSELEIKHLLQAGVTNKSWQTYVQLNITFPHLFNALASSKFFSHKTCIIFGNHSYTYRALNEKINQLSHYLLEVRHKKLLPKETKVCMYLEPSIDAIITILAIMKAGFVYVPLNVELEIATDKLIKIVNDCNPAILITHSQFVNNPLITQLSSTQLSIFYLDKEQVLLNQFSTKHPQVKLNANDAAYILYTSGSTGVSKGVCIEHQGLYNRFLSHKRLLNITSQDKIALFASLSFDASIMEMMLALLTGATLCIIPQKIRLNIFELGELYKKHAVTIAIFTPSMLRILNPKDFSHMRVVISTGEPLDNLTFEKRYWIDEAKTRSRLFVNGYGPAEATICTTLGLCTPKTGLHIGKAIQGVKIFVLEENPANVMQPKRVGESQRGELYISGIGIAREYHDKNNIHGELNKKKFLNILHPDDHDKPQNQQRFIRVYRSGDAMRCINGKLEFLERLDRQVKIYGKLIAPEEIDFILKSSPIIDDAYVDIDINNNGHPIITAYLILKNHQQQPDLIQLYQLVNQSLNKTMCPSRWVVISKDQLRESLNINGKLVRQKLPTRNVLTYQRLRTQSVLAPRDQIEEKLLAIWSEVLNIEDIGFKYSVTDNFYYLGGTSIQCAIMLDKINNYCKKLNLSPPEFLENPTVASIARRIRRIYEMNYDSKDYNKKYYPIVQFPNKIPFSAIQSSQIKPLFLAHTMFGNPTQDYSELLLQFASTRPIFGLEARGLQNSLDMNTTYVEMASDFVTQILDLQSEGPYLLAGWSSGGIIVFEIAKQLQNKGQQVAICCIDSIYSDYYQQMTTEQFGAYLLKSFSERILPHLGLKNIEITEKELSIFPKYEQIEKIIFACEQSLLKTGRSVKQESCLLNVISAMLTANIEYQYTHNVTHHMLIASSDSQKQTNKKLCWPVSTIFQNHITVEGDHFSIMSSDKALATLLNEFCNYNEAKFKLTPLIKQLQQRYQNQLRPKSKTNQIQLVNTNNNIKLQKLDNLFITADNKNHRHILIYQRDGSLSNICDFIAYEWAQGTLWSKEFDLVLWINIEDISQLFQNNRIVKKIDLTDIIMEELIDCTGLLENISQEDMKNNIRYISKRTLFLIRGIENIEIEQTPYTKVIRDLLYNKEIAIIATMAHESKLISQFDLVYENGMHEAIAENEISTSANRSMHIGLTDFKRIQSEKSKRVDKTLFIKHIIDDSTSVKLILRLRRFCKTSNMSMLKYFFTRIDAKSNRLLFMKTKIWQCGPNYQKMQGMFPVIFLTFYDIKESTYQDSLQKIVLYLSSLYKEFKKILYDGVLNDNVDEQKYYQSIIDCKANHAELTISLRKLTDYLHQQYQQPTIVLIDEYDTPINSAFEFGYFKEITNLIRGLFLPALKDNPHLMQAVLTGIFRVAKESIFSTLNNPVVYSMLDDTRYHEDFGFTVEEIKELAPELTDLSMEQMKKYYGGYNINNKLLLNPWSVVNHFHRNNTFDQYWINTGDANIITIVLQKMKLENKKIFFQFLEDLQFLCEDESNILSKELDQHMTFQDLENNPKKLWSFLLMSGYLTARASTKNAPSFPPAPEEIYTTNIAIPNLELRLFFQRFLKQYPHSKIKKYFIAIFRKLSLILSNIELRALIIKRQCKQYPQAKINIFFTTLFENLTMILPYIKLNNAIFMMDYFIYNLFEINAKINKEFLAWIKSSSLEKLDAFYNNYPEFLPTSLIENKVLVRPPDNNFRGPSVFMGDGEILSNILETAEDLLSQLGNVVFRGPVGMGKTYAVLRLFNAKKDSYDRLIWCSAINKQHLNDCYCEALQHVAIFNQAIDCANVFKRWLINTKNWLLVLADLEDNNLIAELQSSISPLKRQHILITSKSISSPSSSIVTFTAWTKEQAKSFISQLIKTNNETLSNQLDKLVNQLNETTPLVMQQLAEYISFSEKNNVESIDALIQIIAKLQNTTDDLIDYSEDLYVIGEIVLNQILQRGRNKSLPIEFLLSYISFLDSRDISIKFLCSVLQEKHQASAKLCNDTINLLQGYSSIFVVFRDKDSISVRDFFQSVIKNSKYTQHQQYNILNSLIELLEYNLGSTIKFDKIKAKSYYLHINTIYKYLTKIENLDSSTLPLMHRCKSILQLQHTSMAFVDTPGFELPYHQDFINGLSHISSDLLDYRELVHDYYLRALQNFELKKYRRAEDILSQIIRDYTKSFANGDMNLTNFKETYGTYILCLKLLSQVYSKMKEPMQANDIMERALKEENLMSNLQKHFTKIISCSFSPQKFCEDIKCDETFSKQGSHVLYECKSSTGSMGQFTLKDVPYLCKYEDTITGNKNNIIFATGRFKLLVNETELISNTCHDNNIFILQKNSMLWNCLSSTSIGIAKGASESIGKYFNSNFAKTASYQILYLVSLYLLALFSEIPNKSWNRSPHYVENVYAPFILSCMLELVGHLLAKLNKLSDTRGYRYASTMAQVGLFAYVVSKEHWSSSVIKIGGSAGAYYLSKKVCNALSQQDENTKNTEQTTKLLFKKNQ